MMEAIPTIKEEPLEHDLTDFSQEICPMSFQNSDRHAKSEMPDSLDGKYLNCLLTEPEEIYIKQENSPISCEYPTLVGTPEVESKFKFIQSPAEIGKDSKNHDLIIAGQTETERQRGQGDRSESTHISENGTTQEKTVFTCMCNSELSTDDFKICKCMQERDVTDSSSNSSRSVKERHNNFINTNTKKEHYSCVVCGKLFNQKSNLSTHMNMHSGNKPYSCNECGKSFPFKYRLVNHFIIHTGKKPFSCSECSKSFPRKDALDRHMYIHTGVKPYSCVQCGRPFIHKYHLDRHLEMHMGHKPFSCGECGKSFTQKGHLSRHLYKHAGQKYF